MTANINNLNFRVVQSSTRLNEYYPLREDINVVLAYDLIANSFYTNDYPSDLMNSISEGGVADQDKSLREVFDSHFENKLGAGRVLKPINSDLFYSYTLANWLLSNGRNQYANIMRYRNLYDAFFTTRYRYISGYTIFRTGGSIDKRIIVFPGAVYEHDGNDAKLLFGVVVKKEYATDFLFRASLERTNMISINPDSIGLLVDSSFDHKTYDYKGLRSYYRKNIKPMFEERESLIEMENLVSLFKKEVRLPSFLVPEEKDQWVRDTIEKSIPI